MKSEITTSNNANSNQLLIKDLRYLIDNSKSKVARTANSIMTMTYWSIGKRISQEILKDTRADYGEQVVKNVAHHLSAEYGKGYTRTSIIRMVQFYQSFNDEQIGVTLSHHN